MAFLRNFMDYMSAAEEGSQYDFEEIIKSFRESMSQLKDIHNMQGIDLKFTQNTNVKPEGFSKKLKYSDLSNLRPLTEKDLVLNTTHRGCFLFGMIDFENAFYGISSLEFILRDCCGRILLVAVYNLPDARRRASSVFHKGRIIAIKEPFFKRSQDCRFRVRVDDPNDIIDYPVGEHFQDPDSKSLVTGDATKFVQSWKNLGNTFFSSIGQEIFSLEKTLFCYNTAMFINQKPNYYIGGEVVDLVDISAGCYGEIFADPPNMRLKSKCTTYAACSMLGGETAKSGAGKYFFKEKVFLPESQKLLEECSQQPVNKNTTNLLSLLFSNCAQCSLQLKDYAAAIRESVVAIALNPHNVKGDLRLCQALVSCNTTLELGKRIAEAASFRWRTLKGKNCTEANVFNEILNQTNSSQENQTLLWTDVASITSDSNSLWKMIEQYLTKRSDVLQSTWVKEKERGATSYGEKDYKSSKNHFENAIALTSSCGEILKKTSVLVCNRSMAYLRSGVSSKTLEELCHHKGGMTSINGNSIKQTTHKRCLTNGVSVKTNPDTLSTPDIKALLLQRALSDAAVATLLNPFGVKGWIRQCQAYRHLGMQDAALKVLTEAKKFFKQANKMLLPSDVRDQSIEFLLLETTSIEKETDSITRVFPMSEKQKRESDYLHEAIKQQTSNGDCEGLLECLPPGIEKMGVMGVVPQFHIEFPKECGWPKGIFDSTKILTSWYNNSRSNSLLTSMMSPGLITAEILVKRFNGPKRMAYVMECAKEGIEMGHVFDFKGINEQYPMLRSLFANNPNRPEVLTSGATHVAVGFNDLSFLISSMSAYMAPSESDDNILRFEGIDLNPYCVAKTLVIIEMFNDATPAQILEVWFSSSWSVDTLSQFKVSLAKVEKQYRGGERLSAAEREVFSPDPQVMSYLNHWKCVDRISLLEARRKWTDLHKSRSYIGSLLRKKDRLASCYYILTGDVFSEMADLDYELGDHEVNCEVGNVTMWSCPSGSPPFDPNGSIFDSVCTSDLLTAHSKQPTMSLLSLIVRLFLERITKLKHLHERGLVKMRVFCGRVSVENEKVIKMINKWDPRSVSWSNLVDYGGYDSFHEMARSCSKNGNVVHFGYSMNWTSTVFGASISDYAGNEKKALDDCLSLYSASGVDMIFPLARELFAWPPCAHPIDIGAFCLGTGFISKWKDFFLSEAEASLRTASIITPNNNGLHMADIYAPPVWNPIGRIVHVPVDLVWTYDAEILFGSEKYMY